MDDIVYKKISRPCQGLEKFGFGVFYAMGFKINCNHDYCLIFSCCVYDDLDYAFFWFRVLLVYQVTQADPDKRGWQVFKEQLDSQGIAEKPVQPDLLDQ